MRHRPFEFLAERHPPTAFAPMLAPGPAHSAAASTALTSPRSPRRLNPRGLPNADSGQHGDCGGGNSSSPCRRTKSRSLARHRAGVEGSPQPPRCARRCSRAWIKQAGLRQRESRVISVEVWARLLEVARPQPRTSRRRHRKPAVSSSTKLTAMVCPGGAHLQGPLFRATRITVLQGRLSVPPRRRRKPNDGAAGGRRASASARHCRRGMVRGRPAADAHSRIKERFASCCSKTESISRPCGCDTASRVGEVPVAGVKAGGRSRYHRASGQDRRQTAGAGATPWRKSNGKTAYEA